MCYVGFDWRDSFEFLSERQTKALLIAAAVATTMGGIIAFCEDQKSRKGLSLPLPKTKFFGS